MFFLVVGFWVRGAGVCVCVWWLGLMVFWGGQGLGFRVLRSLSFGGFGL